MFQSIIMLLSASLVTFSPLGVDWGKKHVKYPDIESYQYYYGDIQWGQVIYYGKKDLVGLESEIHLTFDANKIVKAMLILGPAGLNDWNCIQKYKEVTKILKHKYGNFSYIREIKDPDIEDLLIDNACHAVSIGMHEIITYWNHKNFKIEMSLIAEDGDFYIEILYLDKNRENKRKLKKDKKIIKHF